MWKIFISHASEDKNEVARPLATLLGDYGISVWYDEYELKLGDSLRQRIDEGLATSDYGIVILSKHFFAKQWPLRELNGLSSKEDGKILPIWHNITKKYIARLSPMLADKVGISTKKGLEIVKDAILRAIDWPSDNQLILERIAKKVNKKPQNLTKSDYQRIKVLDLVAYNISDIDFLRNLTNLQTLRLNRTKVTNIKPIEKLTKLQELDLSGVHLDSIKPLEKLVKLQKLCLGGTKIRSIVSLKKLTNLQELSLSGLSRVKCIKSLKKLVKLEKLYLTETDIDEIASLKDLTKLKGLWLDQTHITNFQPLKKLSNLESLWLEKTKINNLKPLEKLVGLTELWLRETPVKDIEPLKKLINLKEVYLPDNSNIRKQLPNFKKAIPNCKVILV